MFLPEMDIQQARQQFWSAVAFNNFCQEVVAKRGADCPCLEKSVQALQATMKILKPKLVIAWTTQIWNYGFNEHEYQDQEKVNGAIPRVVDKADPRLLE